MAPAQLLFNRDVRSTIPTITEKGGLDYKDLHNKANEAVEKKQQKAKAYFDTKRRVRHSNIVVGTRVLVKQQYRNKLTPPFDPNPLIVTKVNGTMVTAERNDYVITRNISYFKKYYQNERNRNIKETTQTNEEGEEDTGDELLGSNKQPVPPEPRRYPVRNRKKPKYY